MITSDIMPRFRAVYDCTELLSLLTWSIPSRYDVMAMSIVGPEGFVTVILSLVFRVCIMF
jgi:hypothetical protein